MGNTLAEAELAVELASRGLLRPVIADVYPLERVNEALDRLRRGEVVGRLVIAP